MMTTHENILIFPFKIFFKARCIKVNNVLTLCYEYISYEFHIIDVTYFISNTKMIFILYKEIQYI